MNLEANIDFNHTSADLTGTSSDLKTTPTDTTTNSSEAKAPAGTCDSDPLPGSDNSAGPDTTTAPGHNTPSGQNTTSDREANTASTLASTSDLTGAVPATASIATSERNASTESDSPSGRNTSSDPTASETNGAPSACPSASEVATSTARASTSSDNGSGPDARTTSERQSEGQSELSARNDSTGNGSSARTSAANGNEEKTDGGNSSETLSGLLAKDKESVEKGSFESTSFGASGCDCEMLDRERRRIHLFGVFDGHGGSEVSSFTSKFLVSELQNSPQFLEGNFEIAFKVAYCNLDRILRQDWINHFKHYPMLSEPARQIKPPLISRGSSGTHASPRPQVSPQRTHSPHSQAQPSSAESGGNTLHILGNSVTCDECGCVCPNPNPPCHQDAAPKEPEELDDSQQPTTLGPEEESPTNSSPDDSDRRLIKAHTGMTEKPGIVAALAHGMRNFLGVLGNGVGKAQRSTSGITDGPTSAENLRNMKNVNKAYFAGCTAISILIVEDMLYIANAGDSRGVLCRGGKAEDLSIDHKPTLPDERSRIYAAGGFVDCGRVNGNLNLSRAIGDLMYKQDSSLPPEKQIVSGFPDVKKIQLMPEDEFIVLGCDGIWEFFSSQDVVDFVRGKIRQQEAFLSSTSSLDYAPKPNEKKKIDTLNRRYVLEGTVESLFDTLISPNPTLFEYGCDNMTAIIIDLKPGHNCPCKCHDKQRMLFQDIYYPSGPLNHPPSLTANDSLPEALDSRSERQAFEPKPVKKVLGLMVDSSLSPEISPREHESPTGYDSDATSKGETKVEGLGLEEHTGMHTAASAEETYSQVDPSKAPPSEGSAGVTTVV